MSEQMKHTPEPWEWLYWVLRYAYKNPSAFEDNEGQQFDPIEARFMVAAYNACAGIPTEALEAGVVREARETLDLLEWNDDGECPWCHRPRGYRDEYGRWSGDHADDCRIAALLAKLKGGAES